MIKVNDNIKELIDEFDSSMIKKVKNEETALNKKRQKFVDDYTVDKINSLSLEEYCVGYKKAKNKGYETFCYRIENEMNALGNMHGATAYKFGIYYGKDDSGKFVFKHKGKYGKKENEILKNIKVEIINLLKDGKNKNYKNIEKNKIAPIFKYKILSTYYPEIYIDIFNEDHIDEFIDALGCKQKFNSMIEKHVFLVEYKNAYTISKKWTNHEFMCFLYNRIPIPSWQRKKAVDAQKNEDKKYEKAHQYNIGISTNDWKKMLLDRNIFHDENIELLKLIYQNPNHASTCKNIELIKGVAPQTYNKPVVALARRVLEYTHKKPQKNNGKAKYWNVIFWGRYTEDNLFEWKIKPRLAKALEEIYPDLCSEIINAEMDEELKNDINNKKFNYQKLSGTYSKNINKKPEEILTKGAAIYKRDRIVALNALKIAGFCCENNCRHKTFIRRNGEINYTEPHHLIPMAYQYKFEKSIDIEENIVSLCSNCHNEIHYGKDADKLITKLWNQRKDLLKSKKIEVSLEELLSFYGYETK